MGLFSSKKKTYTYTSISRMVEDEDIKPTSQTAVIEYVLNPSTQIDSDIENLSLVDHIRTAHTNSMAAKMKRFYQWAEGGNYHYGLPTATLAQSSSGVLTQAFKDLVEKIEGTVVEVNYVQLDAPNHIHIAWQMLQDTYGYMAQTNELEIVSAWEGKPCYLKDMVVHYTSDTLARVTDDSYLDQWGVAPTAGYTPFRKVNTRALPTAFQEDVTAAQDYVVVHYCFDNNGQEQVKNITLDLSKYIVSGNEADLPGMGETTDGLDTLPSSEDDYVMGCYTVTRDGHKVRQYFTYVFGSDGYPTLDAIFDSDERTGLYYPRLYVRLGNTNLAADSLKKTDAYKSSMQAGKKLDLVWDEWVKEIHANVGDTGNIHQAFMNFVVPVNTRDQVLLQYLFKYFQKLYAASTGKQLIDRTSVPFTQEYQNFAVKAGQVIQVRDKVFTQRFQYSGLGMADRVGVIGKVGTYTMTRGEVLQVGIASIFSFRNRTKSITYHSFRFQITDTVYREIRVYNLSSSEQISHSHGTTASGGSENLMIPLDFSMDDDFTTKDRELLYSKSLHLVFNTLKVVKQKWYQSGIFKVVLFIAAVVLSVVSGGQSLTVYTVVVAAVQAIAIGLVVQLLAKLAVKIGISVEIVMIAAAIAMAYAGYLSITDSVGILDLSAEVLLKASNVAMNFTSNIAQEEIKLIADEMGEFQTYAAEKEAAMEQAQEMLGMNEANLLDPVFFLADAPDGLEYLNLHQSPNEYYTRTVHTGNVGVVAFDMITTYVTGALSLPKANTTLSY